MWVSCNIPSNRGSSRRFSDSVRERERLKAQVEEKERELAALSRRLEVRRAVGLVLCQGGGRGGSAGFNLPLCVCSQEQLGHSEADMQTMRAQTEVLVDTLRDIAQVRLYS